MSKLKLAIALSTLIAVTGLWAVPFAGTAHGHLWRAETIAMQGDPGRSARTIEAIVGSRFAHGCLDTWLRAVHVRRGYGSGSHAGQPLSN